MSSVARAAGGDTPAALHKIEDRGFPFGMPQGCTRLCLCVWAAPQSRFARWLEKNGLLFGDGELEWEYLGTANYAATMRIVGGVLCFLAAGFYAFTLHTDSHIHDGDTNQLCIVYCLWWLTIVTSAVFLIIAVTWCAGTPRRLAALTHIGAALFGISLLAYFPYSLCDSKFNAGQLKQQLEDFLANTTGQPGITCRNASLSVQNSINVASVLPWYNVSCGHPGNGTSTSCTVFGALSLFSRLSGFVNESFLMRALVGWVGLEVLIVLNFLPARIMIFVIPVGALVLLTIVGEFTMPDALSNLDFSMTSAVQCSNYLVVTIMGFFSEITISIMAASAALLLHTIARARLKRELFFWTKTLDVSCAHNATTVPLLRMAWLAMN